jgi:alkylresorcinol/alkylpyrone synthase
MGSEEVTATITGHGQALPGVLSQQQLWDGYFKAHYRDHPLARTVWEKSGITTRRGVVDPTQEDISSWGTGARMRRFVEEGMPLGREAVGKALADAGLDPAEVGLFAVASCTGYATPGLDIMLARDLGMSDGTQRLHIGHMGCYAALPGLGAVSDFVVARQKPAVLLCLELTSLHVQPAPPEEPSKADLQQMVAHALFSDAAAAIVLEPGATAGLEVVDAVARTDVSTSDHMTWDVTDLGFVMGLSPKVPDVLGVHVGPVVEELLSRNGLTTADVQGWAVHPGGRRIVEVVAERLGLSDAQTADSFAVLDEIGNCSSATVLLVLERVAASLPPGTEGDRPTYVVAMAFGPGLTLCASLLRRT